MSKISKGASKKRKQGKSRSRILLKIRFGPLPTATDNNLWPLPDDTITETNWQAPSVDAGPPVDLSTMRQKQKQKPKPKPKSKSKPTPAQKPTAVNKLSPEPTATPSTSDWDESVEETPPFMRNRMARFGTANRPSSVESSDKEAEPRPQSAKNPDTLVSYEKIDRLGPQLMQVPPLPIYKHISGELYHNIHQPNQPSNIWIERVRVLRRYVDDLRIFVRLDIEDRFDVVWPFLGSIIENTKEHTSEDFTKMRLWALAKEKALKHANTMFQQYGTVPINTVLPEDRGWYWPVFGEYNEEDLPFAPPTIDANDGGEYATETLDVGPDFEERTIKIFRDRIMASPLEDGLRLPDLPLGNHDARRMTNIKKNFPMREPHRQRDRIGLVNTASSMSSPQPMYMPSVSSENNSSGNDADHELDTSGDLSLSTLGDSSGTSPKHDGSEEGDSVDERSNDGEHVKKEPSED